MFPETPHSSHSHDSNQSNMRHKLVDLFLDEVHS
jgi:hypothetical protein